MYVKYILTCHCMQCCGVNGTVIIEKINIAIGKVTIIRTISIHRTVVVNSSVCIQWLIQDYREGGALDRAKRATVRGGSGGLAPQKMF